MTRWRRERGWLLSCGGVGELLLADLLRQVGPVAIEASEAAGAGLPHLFKLASSASGRHLPEAESAAGVDGSLRGDCRARLASNSSRQKPRTKSRIAEDKLG
jgi:hypothetical protein